MGNKIEYILFGIIVVLCLFIYFQSCKRDNTVLPHGQLTTVTIKKDTLVMYPPATLSNSDEKIKIVKKIVKIPVNADSALIEHLINERDSLACELTNRNVLTFAILDTVLNADTLFVKYNELKQCYDSARIGYAPRKIQYQEKITFVPILQEKSFWNNPYVLVSGGLVFGAIGGYIIKR